ncbi:MAG: hypothetical protein ABI193_08355 [Minicystis sp.]
MIPQGAIAKRPQLNAALGDEFKEEIVTVAEQLIERGRQQGLEKGLEKGLEHGRGMLLDQLGERFGALTDEVIARVMAASPSELRTWGKRVLTASRLDDLLGEG